MVNTMKAKPEGAWSFRKGFPEAIFSWDLKEK